MLHISRKWTIRLSKLLSDVNAAAFWKEWVEELRWTALLQFRNKAVTCVIKMTNKTGKSMQSCFLNHTWNSWIWCQRFRLYLIHPAIFSLLVHLQKNFEILICPKVDELHRAVGPSFAAELNKKEFFMWISFRLVKHDCIVQEVLLHVGGFLIWHAEPAKV